MNHNALFNQPRIRLSLLYAGVMGGILLSLGYVTHRVVERSVSRVVDRELHLLAATLNARLAVGLQGPGQLAPNAATLLPELCWANRPCPPQPQNSPLLQLIQTDYSLRLLDLQGQPIAAIGEPPDRFGANPQLQEFYTVQDAQGDAYHLHLMPLQTQQGQLWGYLQVGRSVQKFDDYMRGLHRLIMFGVPAAMVMIGAASWALAGVAMRPIYHAYGQMQQFTANAAHELRTPIAAIQAIVEVAMADDAAHPQTSPQTSPQTLQALHRQTARLGRLTQDLLLLSRLDARPGHQDGPIGTLGLQAICLNELVEDLEEELVPVAMGAGVELGREMLTDTPLWIAGDSDQIYRLISNLITNAIQHSARADPVDPVSPVKITLTRHQNQALIAVQDWGVGIPAAELPHLFDRFHRVAADRHRQTGGAGLGLAIARAIAIAHRGQIRVQSQVGQGSTFTVELPLISAARVETRRSQTQGRRA
jgi:signal transduction histidine kinase